MIQRFARKLVHKIRHPLFKKTVGRDPLSILERTDRYKPATYPYLGKVFHFPDAASFVSIFREVFSNEIYKFNTNADEPYVIDCGANIGLSVIYFKSIYPNAKIVAFEPDNKIFNYLQTNTSQYHYSGLTLLNKGVWKDDGVIQFKHEGADAGRISFEFDQMSFKSTQQIEVVKLSNYIDRQVSLLKIDIEGAEVEVLQEIEEKLKYVDRLFIEFHSFEANEQHLDIMLDILSRNHFRYYLDSPSRFRQKPFIDKTTLFSFDFLINIYATRKVDNL